MKLRFEEGSEEGTEGETPSEGTEEEKEEAPSEETPSEGGEGEGQ